MGDVLRGNIGSCVARRLGSWQVQACGVSQPAVTEGLYGGERPGGPGEDQAGGAVQELGLQGPLRAKPHGAGRANFGKGLKPQNGRAATATKRSGTLKKRTRQHVYKVGGVWWEIWFRPNVCDTKGLHLEG